MTTEKIPCSKKVWSEWHRHRCTKNATVERNGAWFCGTHDPVRIAERNAKRDAKRQVECKLIRERWRRDAAVRQLCKGVDTDTLEKLGAGWVAAMLAELRISFAAGRQSRSTEQDELIEALRRTGNLISRHYLVCNDGKHECHCELPAQHRTNLMLLEKVGKP